MTATATATAPVIKKNYKGGWKDKTLRSNPAALSTPMTGPVRMSAIWTEARPAPLVVDGVIYTRSGTTAFEICECGEPTGKWFFVLEDSTLSEQDRVYGWARCRCVPDGASILDYPAIHMVDLVSGQPLAVVRKVGVATTHDLARYGYEEFGNLPGVGPTTVQALRAAVRAAGLPEWRI